MKEQRLLQVLYRIRACLRDEDWSTASQYTSLEIENIEGVTPTKCKSRIDSDYYYCDRCRILNCSNNVNSCRY